MRLRRNLAQLEGATKRASTTAHKSTRDPSSSSQRISKKKKTRAKESVRLDLPPLDTRTSVLFFIFQRMRCLKDLRHLVLLQKCITQRLTRDESVQRHACDLDGEWISRVETVPESKYPLFQARRLATPTLGSATRCPSEDTRSVAKSVAFREAISRTRGGPEI